LRSVNLCIDSHCASLKAQVGTLDSVEYHASGHSHTQLENHCPPNSPPIYCDTVSESPPNWVVATNATKTETTTAITRLYLPSESPPDVSTAIGFPDLIELRSNSNTQLAFKHHIAKLLSTLYLDGAIKLKHDIWK